MTRLNIFIDETGEFGFEEGSSELYGISFTFHEQKDNITPELLKLNNKLSSIGYTNMIHMADLIMKRGDYSKFNIGIRKEIFNSIYHFSRKIPVRYRTIIVNKNYTDNAIILRKKILIEIDKMISTNESYFKKFDTIIMYYDNGQETLGAILDSTFSRFNGFEHRKVFDHKDKRLFQVSDMLSYIDKYDYKYKHKLKFTKSEQYFFEKSEIRKIIKALGKKRL